MLPLDNKQKPFFVLQELIHLNFFLIYPLFLLYISKQEPIMIPLFAMVKIKDIFTFSSSIYLFLYYQHLFYLL